MAAPSPAQSSENAIFDRDLQLAFRRRAFKRAIPEQTSF